MAINWSIKEGQKFFVGGPNAQIILDWCKDNISPDKWEAVLFITSLYIHLYESGDIIIFKLKFATMYEEYVFNKDEAIF